MSDNNDGFVPSIQAQSDATQQKQSAVQSDSASVASPQKDSGGTSDGFVPSVHTKSTPLEETEQPSTQPNESGLVDRAKKFVQGRIDNFEKSYREDKSPTAQLAHHVVDTAGDEGTGMLKNLGQISAPGIVASVLNKKAPSVAAHLPKIITENATPIKQLPGQLVENYAIGGGLEGGLPGEEPTVSPKAAMEEKPVPSGTASKDSIGKILVDEGTNYLTRKLKNLMPGHEIIPAFKRVVDRISGLSEAAPEAPTPSTEGTPWGARIASKAGFKPILPEASAPETLRSIGSQLEEALGNTEETQSKISRDPRKQALLDNDATAEQIKTILSTGKNSPTSRVGLSRLAGHFGIDLGDKAIGRAKGDIAAGTHVEPAVVLQKIFDEGHSAADVAKAVEEGKHLPKASGGSQGATALSPNASGESGASLEAVNRLASENKAGTKYWRIDTRKGTAMPLTSADRVDLRANDYDEIVKVDKDGTETTLDKGDKARPRLRSSKILLQ